MVNAALSTVLIWKGRQRQFPFFTAWILFSVLFTILLFAAYRLGSPRLYRWIYWPGGLLDILFQVSVVFELAHHLLRSTVSSAGRTWRFINALMVTGVFVAFFLAWFVHPAGPGSLVAWEVRGDLFTSLLVCEFFTVIVFASQRFGLYWRSHAVGLGLGLTFWAIISLIVDLLHGYWGETAHFKTLDHLRMWAYLGTIVFWMASFWRDEPEKKPLNAEMRDAILQITDRVSYDLAKVLGTRGKEFR